MDISPRKKLIEAAQDGRIYVELVNGAFLNADGMPDQYRAGIERAIAKGWLLLHESGTYVKFTPSGAELFAWLLRHERINAAGGSKRPDGVLRVCAVLTISKGSRAKNGTVDARKDSPQSVDRIIDMPELRRVGDGPPFSIEGRVYNVSVEAASAGFKVVRVEFGDGNVSLTNNFNDSLAGL